MRKRHRVTSQGKAQDKVPEMKRRVGGKAAELWKLSRQRRPGYLERGTPSKRYTFDEGKTDGDCVYPG